MKRDSSALEHDPAHTLLQYMYAIYTDNTVLYSVRYIVQLETLLEPLMQAGSLCLPGAPGAAARADLRSSCSLRGTGRGVGDTQLDRQVKDMAMTERSIIASLALSLPA